MTKSEASNAAHATICRLDRQPQPLLVQLDDELLAAIDRCAESTGASRSELVRTAIERYLAADIDRRIVEGYSRIPPDALDPIADAAALRLIREEPW